MNRLLLSLLALIISVSVFAQSPKSEIRGIWINSDKMPKTETEAKILVNEYYKAGFNLLFPEVMCRGYAIYKSDILERDPRFREADDVLPVMIETAHSMNMEVHPWVWCFRAGYTNHPGAIITAHPEWLEESKYGQTLSVNEGMWLSPINTDARNYLIDIFKEIVSKYSPDGLHLDYIRYETQSPILYGYSKEARERFANENADKDPLRLEYLSKDFLSWLYFREAHISSFVAKTNKTLKEIKPDLILSAAVAQNPTEARVNYMQNWTDWAKNGLVDMIVPMTYMTDDTKFSSSMQTQLEKLKGKVWTAIGIGSHNFTKAEERNIDQINLARETDYMGMALFASQYMTDTLEEKLKTTVWKEKASLPFRDNSEESGKITEYKKSIKETYPPESLDYLLPEKIIPCPKITVRKRVRNTENISPEEWTDYTPFNIEYNNMGISATQKTVCRMTYDSKAVYIFFECDEPNMAEIKADAVKRDGWTFYDDSVEVFIQMMPTVAKYNHFSVNTLNTHFDQQMFNTSWSKDWESKIQKSDKGWKCEFKIPFKELSVDTPKNGDMWRMNFTRNRFAGGTEENLCWSVPYGSYHTPERFGYVFFE